MILGRKAERGWKCGFYRVYGEAERAAPGHPMEMLRTKLREPVGSLSGPFTVGVALVEQSEGGLGVVVGGGVRAAVAPGADCQM